MSNITLRNIDKYYGGNHVLKNLSLEIKDGEFMTLLGPSGCGKTTTLRVIAGLEKPQAGVIHMDGREVVNARELFFESPGNRNLNLVFQSYALWPHMTVYKNVAFGLSVAKVPKGEIKTLVTRALERMHIQELANRYPFELSGGQQQRVAIARAIVDEPRVLLLDEPLSNLDAKLRVEMRMEIKRLHQDLGTTIVYVTHDQVEALTMSSKIAIFFDGSLEQVDTPMSIYQNPISLKVADFIGNPKINLIEAAATRDGDRLRVRSALGEYVFPAETFTPHMPEETQFSCILGIRPEKIDISTRPREDGVEGAVYSSMPAGSETIVNVVVDGCALMIKENDLKDYQSDQKLWITLNPNKVNVFSKESGLLVKRAATDF